MKIKMGLTLIILSACFACTNKPEVTVEPLKTESEISAQQCPAPQIIEKTVEVPKIITKIVEKEKIVIKEVIKEVVREKIVYVEKSGAGEINNIFSAYASYGPSGNLLDQQYGGIDYAVAEKNTTVGFQYQRRVLDNVWGLVGANLHGDFSLGLGYSFK
jgi:hypothetical protein